VILIAVIGFLYWLVISQIFSTSEVGQAIKIISLVLLITVFIQLGFEYPLLKRSSMDKDKIYGTTLAIELGITLASVPFLLFVMDFIYQVTETSFYYLAVGFLLSNQLMWVSRYILLGISKVKDVLITDLLGAVFRFLSVIILVYVGFEIVAILGSFFIHFLFTALTFVVLIKRKKFEFKIPSLQYVKELIKQRPRVGIEELISKRLLIK